MESVKKLKSAELVKKFKDALFLKLPLPRVNPDAISALSLVFSIVFLFSSNLYFQIIILAMVLILDGMDGLVAEKYKYRKNKKEKNKGWMVDVTVDRLSEGVISLVSFIPLFPLFILNSVLALWSYKTKRHLILPLRQILLLYLIIKIIF